MTRKAWNYRIILHDVNVPEPWYGLHEVYESEGCKPSWTDPPQAFWCYDYEGPGGIVASLRRALEAAETRPVLIESQLGNVLDTGSPTND